MNCRCLIRKFNRGTNSTPFNAVYGHEAYNGLELINQLFTEQKNIKSAKQLFTILGVFVKLIYFFVCKLLILNKRLQC